MGVTSDLERRVWEHKSKAVAGFTQQYNVTKLVYFECYDDAENAIKREKQIKNWNRAKKNFLVNSMNSAWLDLSLDWYSVKDSSAALGMTKE